ncbi:hypothetical protein [Serinicoccus sp. CNJ-927]|uniref:hypothetical protein n=1 Tax=Serinicoccus sp. CNJ-927 TaxID=1904970 RepID=UPI00117A3205|nr:hypothetical protein [Serinicoccus sp. CNJ-927]
MSAGTSAFGQGGTQMQRTTAAEPATSTGSLAALAVAALLAGALAPALGVALGVIGLLIVSVQTVTGSALRPRLLVLFGLLVVVFLVPILVFGRWGMLPLW